MDLALAIAEAIAEVDESIILLGLANSKTFDAGSKAACASQTRSFADRAAYQADGSLCAARKLPAPHDKRRGHRAHRPHGHREGKVTAITGEEVVKSRLTLHVSTVTTLRPSNSLKISARSSPPKWAWRLPHPRDRIKEPRFQLFRSAKDQRPKSAALRQYFRG